jgi:O-acetyl-ADP-ribose deacetylase (regulator of RNase III)
MMTVLKGDLSGLDLDLIVNEANITLMPGSGLNGRIFAKAGPDMLAACRQAGNLKEGDVFLTPAFKLPCKGVIHAIVPANGGGANEQEQLAAAYWNSLAEAYGWMRKHELEHITVGMPIFGIGPYGFDKRRAKDIAFYAVKGLLRHYPEARSMDVIFVCEDNEVYRLVKEALK